MAGTLERAIVIAATVHDGQVDKAGAPYILHPLRLMIGLSTMDERIVAVLHDVIEDSEGRVTADTLLAEGFAAEIVTAVSALTKRNKNEDYDAFIARLAPNPLARKVKLADLQDNTDLSRIANPTEKDRSRVEKYRRAIAYLESLESK